jgi:hypothetical protein
LLKLRASRHNAGASISVTHAPVGDESLLVLPGLWGCTILLMTVFVIAHSHYPGLPAPRTETGGWDAWSDQSHYIEAARAWAHGNLSPALHWYPPGYALLGAPFLPLTPHDRFLLPDLACLIVSQFACAALGRRLFPEYRFARLLGAGAFLIASIGTFRGLVSWLIPWSTTPSAALTLVAFVAILRLAEQPCVSRALAAGSAIGGITLFRPGDAVPVALAAAIALAPAMFAVPIRRAAGMVVAAVLATGAWVAVTVAIIDATSGFGPGTYYALSDKFGFEFRLLPLHWVTFMINARPDLGGIGTQRIEPGLHRGLCEVFPWIIPGVGGIAGCWFGAKERRVHVLLVSWLVLYLALMLSYRDLHILGLWLYGNYHYFKVTQPIFLLYALVLVSRLGNRAICGRVVVTAVATVVLAFGWRASLTPVSATLPPATQHSIAVPPLDRINEVAIVPGTDTWNGFYYGNHVLTLGGRVFHDPYDFRLYPRRRDFLLVPLRSLPSGSGTLTITPDLHIDPGTRARAARQTISFGVPCAFGLAGRSICGSLGAPLIP